MNRGSEWLRWDVHIHTPTTALANQFPKDSWDQYVDKINAAKYQAVALGVTDYCSLQGYKHLRKLWKEGKLPGVKFLFPNIEFRVFPATKSFKGVNLHLLIDPSDDNHIEMIEAALARLSFEYKGEKFNCDEAGLTRLGKKYNAAQTDERAAYEEGVNQFKIDFTAFRKWRDGDTWLKDRTLVAVANGERDGVGGVPKDHGFGAIVEEMFSYADVIFSGNPSDREYWLGNKVDDKKALAEKFGGVKPCLHGCDAHHLDKVLAPEKDRACWIRAEPTFEGLRQVIIEPHERVYIGAEAPVRPRKNWIRSLTVKGASWFPSGKIDLNEGLVAIIGPRGSGKTALADLVAQGADAFDYGSASFLTKAMSEARGTTVELEWAGSATPETRTVGDSAMGAPSVRYLSQNFVEQLCSAEGATDRLIEEIETVVFDALDEPDKLGAYSFRELRAFVTEGSLRRIQELKAEISECADEIARELSARMEIPAKKERLKVLASELKDIENGIGKIVIKGQEEKAKILAKLVDDRVKIEAKVSGLKAKLQELDELQSSLEHKQRANEDFFARLKPTLTKLEIPETDFSKFQVQFGGDFNPILASRKKAIQAEVTLLVEGSTPPKPEDRPLAGITKQIEELQKEISGDATKEKQLIELHKKQKQKQQEQTKLTKEVDGAAAADGRIKAAQEKRISRYLELFVQLGKQKDALNELYQPLAQNLAKAPPERKKLEFFVRQVVNIGKWAERGEQLIDLRKKGEFQEQGILANKAEELLGEGWRSGDAVKIQAGIGAFLDTFKGIDKMLTPTATLAQFADWLFSTDHIDVTFGIRYEGIDIERLSPGTRGIVLLILYLAVDLQDDRPLVIDQPEENLDPQSIYEVLTEYFRETRERRQVIIVTHNPNLVVNTDSDQVIVASSERVPGKALPNFNYESGGLETPNIRTKACRILEGGKAAFLQREMRYALQRATGVEA